MNYYDIVHELSNDKLVDLIKNNKVTWTKLWSLATYKTVSKLKSFTKEQIVESKFESFLNIDVIDEILSENEYIDEIAMKYLKNNGLNQTKKMIDCSEKFILKFLEIYPHEKESLLNKVRFAPHNVNLIMDKPMTEIADIINSGRINFYGLEKLLSKKDKAPLNTLIEEKYYNNVSVFKLLNNSFPRDIPFTQSFVLKMLDQERNLFFQLPIKNQVDFRVLRFTTGNVFYATHDADYDRDDHNNLSKNKIPDSLLNHIGNDENGVNVALFFLDLNKKYITHPNVQLLVKSSTFSQSFKKYKAFMNIKEQDLFQSYAINNIPTEKFTNISFEELDNQKKDVVLKIMINAKNKDVMMTAFNYALQKNINLIKELSIEDKCIFVKNHFEKVIGSDNNREKALTVLLNLVIDVNSKDFKSMATIIKKDKCLESIVSNRLSVDEKIEYIEFTTFKEAKPKSRKP